MLQPDQVVEAVFPAEESDISHFIAWSEGRRRQDARIAADHRQEAPETISNGKRVTLPEDGVRSMDDFGIAVFHWIVGR